MSCQRLDALFYCLFKKAGVDLTSLASMSQQQQSSVNNSALNNANTLSTLAPNSTNMNTWNTMIKQSISDNEEDDSIINRSINEKAISGSNASTAHGNNGVSYNNLVNNYQQNHTIVPAQIQVQVQVQVPNPQTLNASISNIDNTSASSVNASQQQSRLYILSNPVTTNNASSSYAIVDAQNCV